MYISFNTCFNKELVKNFISVLDPNRSKSTLRRQKIDRRIGITKITYFQQPLNNLRDHFCSFKDYDIGPGLASGKT